MFNRRPMRSPILKIFESNLFCNEFIFEFVNIKSLLRDHTGANVSLANFQFSDGALNQSINQSMVEVLRSRSFRLIDWLTIKLTLTWLVYWIRTAQSVFMRAGLKWPNTAGQYSKPLTSLPDFIAAFRAVWSAGGSYLSVSFTGPPHSRLLPSTEEDKADAAVVALFFPRGRHGSIFIAAGRRTSAAPPLLLVAPDALDAERWAVTLSWSACKRW